MIRKLWKYATHPMKYVRMAMKMVPQPFARFFGRSSFYLQGQMDIHASSRWYNPEFVAYSGGMYPKTPGPERRIHDLEPWDSTRRDMLVMLLKSILDRSVPGDMVELGVYQGTTAKLLHHYMPDRELHLFDTFEGFTDRSVASEHGNTSVRVSADHFADTSLRAVQQAICAQNGNVYFHPGFFPDTIPEDFKGRRFAFVHLDADLYEPTVLGLEYFYPRMSAGGMIVVHDYNAWIGARKAVDDFLADKPEIPIPMPDKSGSALIVRGDHP